MAKAVDYRSRVIDGELDELVTALPAIAIEGAKAVGKTATASQRAQTVVEFDEPNQLALAEADIDRILSEPPPVLIDEWQKFPPVWDRVRRRVDAGASAGQMLLTGSASPADTGTHSGGGRIVSLRMRPLSLFERLPGEPSVSLAALLEGKRSALEGGTEVDLTTYTEEIIQSGFPGMRELKGRALRAQLDGYLTRVVDRDFKELGHPVRQPDSLRRWMAAYAASTATTTTFEKIRDASTSGQDQKPAKTTVLPYRDILERLFILDPLPAWKPRNNQISGLGQPPKHHLADPALAARLVGANADSLLSGESAGPPVPRDGTQLGALFESLVTQSVRVYAQAQEARVAHLRSHRGEHEVDLICERSDGRVIAIEVKLSQGPDSDSVRHLKWLKGRLGDDLLDSVIITTGEAAYRREDGIAVVPAALLGP